MNDVLIPVEAAHRNEIIPPGVTRATMAVSAGLFRSRLWQSEGVIDASGASCDAPGARDYSVEVFGGGRDAGDRHYTGIVLIFARAFASSGCRPA
jgi:hypothetical protein